MLDFELDLLLNFDEELDLEDEDFLESDFWEDLFVGLLSFFVLELDSWSLGEDVPPLFSDLGSLSSVVLFLLGSLLLGSLDSFSDLGSYTEMFCAKLEIGKLDIFPVIKVAQHGAKMSKTMQQWKILFGDRGGYC